MWLGPIPRVNIMDPEVVKEVLSKNFDYKMPRINPLFKLLATGLANYDDDQWTKHRKIINPAFHMEKLKVIPESHFFFFSFFSPSFPMSYFIA